MIAGCKRITIVDPSSKNNNDMQFLLEKDVSENKTSILDDIILFPIKKYLNIPHHVSFEI